MLVVFHAPALQDDTRFGQCAKELAVQALIAQLVVEALDVAVSPRTAGRDVEGFNLPFFEPVLDSISGKLQSVITAQMPGRAVSQDLLADCLEYPFYRTDCRRCFKFASKAVSRSDFGKTCRSPSRKPQAL